MKKHIRVCNIQKTPRFAAKETRASAIGSLSDDLSLGLLLVREKFQDSHSPRLWFRCGLRFICFVIPRSRRVYGPWFGELAEEKERAINSVWSWKRDIVCQWWHQRVGLRKYPSVFMPWLSSNCLEIQISSAILISHNQLTDWTTAYNVNFILDVS